MESKGTRGLNFIESMSRQLQEHQYQKAVRLGQGSRQPSHEESKAKQALIELDDETQPNDNGDDEVEVGRWANYRVPNKVEERLSYTKKTKINSVGSSVPVQRYMEYCDRGYLPSLCRSEKTIPKLKTILNQLQCPLTIQTYRKAPPRSATSATGAATKPRSHIGMEALVISNRQQIRPTIKSQRKTSTISYDNNPHNAENRRPPSSSHFKGQPASSAYQKIRRGGAAGGSKDDCEFVYEKEILSQLLKGNVSKGQRGEVAPLDQMLNFFTKTGGDTKRKISMKLGLDKLQS